MSSAEVSATTPSSERFAHLGYLAEALPPHIRSARTPTDSPMWDTLSTSMTPSAWSGKDSAGTESVATAASTSPTPSTRSTASSAFLTPTLSRSLKEMRQRLSAAAHGRVASDSQDESTTIPISDRSKHRNNRTKNPDDDDDNDDDDAIAMEEKHQEREQPKEPDDVKDAEDVDGEIEEREEEEEEEEEQSATNKKKRESTKVERKTTSVTKGNIGTIAKKSQISQRSHTSKTFVAARKQTHVKTEPTEVIDDGDDDKKADEDDIFDDPFTLEGHMKSMPMNSHDIPSSSAVASSSAVDVDPVDDEEQKADNGSGSGDGDGEELEENLDDGDSGDDDGNVEKNEEPEEKVMHSKDRRQRGIAKKKARATVRSDLTMSHLRESKRQRPIAHKSATTQDGRKEKKPIVEELDEDDEVVRRETEESNRLDRYHEEEEEEGEGEGEQDVESIAVEEEPDDFDAPEEDGIIQEEEEVDEDKLSAVTPGVRTGPRKKLHTTTSKISPTRSTESRQTAPTVVTTRRSEKDVTMSKGRRGRHEADEDDVKSLLMPSAEDSEDEDAHGFSGKGKGALRAIDAKRREEQHKKLNSEIEYLQLCGYRCSRDGKKKLKLPLNKWSRTTKRMEISRGNQWVDRNEKATNLLNMADIGGCLASLGASAISGEARDIELPIPEHKLSRLVEHASGGSIGRALSNPLVSLVSGWIQPPLREYAKANAAEMLDVTTTRLLLSKQVNGEGRQRRPAIKMDFMERPGSVVATGTPSASATATATKDKNKAKLVKQATRKAEIAKATAAAVAVATAAATAAVAAKQVESSSSSSSSDDEDDDLSSEDENSTVTSDAKYSLVPGSNVRPISSSQNDPYASRGEARGILPAGRGWANSTMSVGEHGGGYGGEGRVTGRGRGMPSSGGEFYPSVPLTPLSYYHHRPPLSAQPHPASHLRHHLAATTAATPNAYAAIHPIHPIHPVEGAYSHPMPSSASRGAYPSPLSPPPPPSPTLGRIHQSRYVVRSAPRPGPAPLAPPPPPPLQPPSLPGMNHGGHAFVTSHPHLPPQASPVIGVRSPFGGVRGFNPQQPLQRLPEIT